MGPAPKCHFVLGLPSGIPEIPKIRTPTTLEAHNFVCRPPIEVKLKKIVAFIKSFPTVCDMLPECKNVRVIPVF
jgi:hypothetical protein